MKQLFSCLIVLFAFVAATVHVPAAAHADGLSHHADHGAAAVLDGLADELGDPARAPESTTDGMHQHCPTVLDAFTNTFELGPMLGNALLCAHRGISLISFSQAPPTEPPAA
ncbi:MAG: hypothetical protein K2W91_06385 [Novosphingobium sp.]|nr:hypothetical protein [Novosphingobium sp.]